VGVAANASQATVSLTLVTHDRYGKVTQNLVKPLRKWRVERERSQSSQGRFAKFEWDVNCSGCGDPIYAGTPAVVFPDQRVECRHCTGMDLEEAAEAILAGMGEGV
jgi:hypothetical protein